MSRLRGNTHQAPTTPPVSHEVPRDLGSAEESGLATPAAQPVAQPSPASAQGWAEERWPGLGAAIAYCEACVENSTKREGLLDLKNTVDHLVREKRTFKTLNEIAFSRPDWPEIFGVFNGQYQDDVFHLKEKLAKTGVDETKRINDAFKITSRNLLLSLQTELSYLVAAEDYTLPGRTWLVGFDTPRSSENALGLQHEAALLVAPANMILQPLQSIAVFQAQDMAKAELDRDVMLMRLPGSFIRLSEAQRQRWAPGMTRKGRVFVLWNLAEEEPPQRPSDLKKRKKGSEAEVE